MTETVLPCGLTETELRKRVDIERTIAEYGHDPREFTKGSGKVVFGLCVVCGAHREPLNFKHFIKVGNCGPCGVKSRGTAPVEIISEADLRKFVNIEASIEKFGSDPRVLKPSSQKKVVSICIECGKERDKSFFEARKSRRCGSCAAQLLHEQEAFIWDKKDVPVVSIKLTVERMGYDPRKFKLNSHNPVIFICPDCKEEKEEILAVARRKAYCRSCYLKNYSTAKPHDIERINAIIHRIDVDATKKELGIDVYALTSASTTRVISICLECGKRQKALLGNIRKTSICRACANEVTRLKNIGRKHTEEHIAARSGKNCFLYGKNLTRQAGFWYTRQSGETFWIRSVWEAKIADLFTSQGKEWEYEQHTFEVTFVSGKTGKVKEGTYTPDFYENGTLYEIKGHWRDDAKVKFEAFKKAYPDKKIVLIEEAEMEILGLRPRQKRKYYLARAPHCSLTKPS